MQNLAIGIDLGNTKSCVSIYLDGKTMILENCDGERITPSVIFFTSLDEPMVGEYAKRMAKIDADHVIAGFKRLVGRTFDHESVQKILAFLPFTVECDESNNPVVVIPQPNHVLKKTPQELCACILRKLKCDVEEKFYEVVNKIVITVPAHFDARQREVIVAAAKDAGFTVLKLLDEPTAAALSYSFAFDRTTMSCYLVYDLGGANFDVAILRKTLTDFEVVFVGGDIQLGGNDFDNLIVDHVCEKLRRVFDYDPRGEKENLAKLREKCENAKKELSTLDETVIVVSFIPNRPAVDIILTKVEFENLAGYLFQRTIQIVDNCLKYANLSKHSISEVVLSGGSTRIPKIQNALSEYFDGKTLNKFTNPEECVSEGAALQAAMLSKNPRQAIRKMRLKDDLPLSIGIRNFANEMHFVLKRNTPIPARAFCNACVHYDKENRQIMLAVYEGERTDIRKNRLLGEMLLSNLTILQTGHCEILISVKVDENGVITVTAKEKYRQNVHQMQINYIRGSRSQKEITDTLSDAELHRPEDEIFTQFSKLKGFLIKYCARVMYNLNYKRLTDYDVVYEMCAPVRAYIENMEVEQINIVKDLIREIKFHCEPVVRLHNFFMMPEPLPEKF